MVTSRTFTFEIYYEGRFRVKREFSDKEIKSEGGIRNVLEAFFEEIESTIYDSKFSPADTPSSRQRSRNNEYLFGFSYSPHMCFGESEVFGEGCYAIRGDAPTDEINDHGIDFMDTLEDEANAYMEAMLCEHLGSNADLISCEINYVDDPAEAEDVVDEYLNP